LDIVAPDQYKILTVKKGQDIAAAWPIIKKKKNGVVLSTMPPLTQTLGILFRPSNAKYTKQLSEQKKNINQLLGEFPGCHYISQNFNYNFTNWLPLYWVGFQQTTRYTYVLEDLVDLNAVWSGMRENIRSDIRKAQKKGIEVREDLDIDLFLNVNELTFKRQGKKLPYSRGFVKRLDKKCKEKNARKMFFAIDSQNRVHAVLYLVWDKNSAYYLMGGGDPELRSSGATSLLMWEAIKFASTVTKKFDFEGSMIEPVERFFRAFGARQLPYFNIYRMNRWMTMFTATRKLFKKTPGRG